MYENLEKTGNTFGLVRTEWNADGSRPLVRTVEEGNVARQPGKFFRVRTDEGTKVYKYTFSRPDDRQWTERMLKALGRSPAKHGILEALAGFNRTAGNFFTTLRPAFAPLNMLKGLGERIFNSVARGSYVAADGSFIEGPTVAAKTAELSGNMDFLSTYFNNFKDAAGADLAKALGKKPGPASAKDPRFQKYWDEFHKSGADVTIFGLLKRNAMDAQSLLGTEGMGVIRKAIRAAHGTVGYKTIDSVITSYNNAFGLLPVFLHYAAFRESGVPVKSALSYTTEAMNFFKKGETEPYGSALYVFFRPTVQSGANIIRALNPFTKATPAQKARGALTMVGLIAVGLMLTTMLRAMGDDDEGDLNAYDDLDLGAVSNAVCIPGADGQIYKLPVPYGLFHLAWTMAQIFDRTGRGQMSYGDGARQTILAFHRQVLPDTFPAYRLTEDPSDWVLQALAPAAIRPWVDVAVNRNHWGSSIVYGNAREGLRNHEKGWMTTPQKWHDMAKALDEIPLIGPDTHPETLRYITSYYLFGPLQGIVAAMDDSRLYTPDYQTTREALGPFLTAMGASSVWSAPRDHYQTYYYRVKREAERVLYDHGIQPTDPEGKTPTEEHLRREAREAGMTPEWATAYLALRKAINSVAGVNAEARESWRRYRVGQLSDETMGRVFSKREDELQAIFRKFYRLTAGVNFRGDGR